MFEELAKSHQVLEKLLDQGFIDQLVFYHHRLLSAKSLNNTPDFASFLTKLQVTYANIEQQWTNVQHSIRKQMDLIENQMAGLSEEKKINTRAHWVKRLRCNHEFYHTQRNLPLEPKDFDTVKFELVRHLPLGYYPVALLGLDHRNSYLVESLFQNANPFYIADIYNESFSLLNCLPDLARKKVICHYLGNEDDLIGLNNVMPVGQFGFVVAWNLFNYFTEEVIKEWLARVALLLRPGGKFFFTYNNCLDPVNASFVDMTRNGFTIPTRLALFANQAGLEVDIFDSINSTHWAVLSKPGEFHSIRANPGVGKIMTKN